MHDSPLSPVVTSSKFCPAESEPRQRETPAQAALTGTALSALCGLLG